MAKSSSLQKTASKGVKLTSAMAADSDDEDDLSINEQAISASEDEEGNGDDERKHKKLLEAISAMGGRKRKKQNERSEASVQVSEFSVNAEGTGDKVNLSDLLETMEKSSAASNKTKQLLKNLQKSQRTLELPLNKQQTEKIQRSIAYEKTTKVVSSWESIIVQNQKAEQMVFPLICESSEPKPVEQVVSKWKVQTPLEQEIFSLLHKNKQPAIDPILTPAEDASVKAMSLEEAKIRRAELQKARVLQSYLEAKAKREKQIKSKKYRKLKNKGNRKLFVKKFEEMVKTNPEEALDELKRMEMARMKERMSLKHQNSGKWAKSKAIMAKYDDSARKAMQEQLQMNKDLTEKIAVASDDEHENNEDASETVPDFVNDPEPKIDSVNPWMRGQLTHEEPEVSCVTTEDAQTAQEENESEEDELLGEFERKRKLRQADEEDLIPTEEENKTEEPASEVVEEDVSDEEEDASEFNTLFRLMRREKTVEGPNQMQEVEEELLNEGEVRVGNIEDLELLGEVVESQPTAEQSLPETAVEEDTSEPPNKKKREIDLQEVLTKEATVVKVPFLHTVVEEEEEHEEQISLIKEAFAGDDVISDFIKDKRKQEADGMPKEVDLTLPGWGEWGGGGFQPSSRKRERFTIKKDPPPPRQDRKLPDVIISENRSASTAAHQVSQLPFPYQNAVHFESFLRMPIGQTWNTPSVVSKLTNPKVITKMGAIIEPIVKEDCINKTTTQASEEPAITLGGNKSAEVSSEKPRRRRSQKKKKNKN